MKYKIESLFNDGMAEAPPFTVEVDCVDDLANDIFGNMVNDYNEPFGIGHTVLITRLAD